MSQKVFFVGSPSEVAHHAAPLADRLAYEIASPDQVVKESKRGDLAVFYSEHFDRFRECVQQLKRRGVATLYMIDGILEWRNAWENRADEVACPWTMRPALADKVACIGYSQIAVLNSWGNSAKTELVGIPRFDHLRDIDDTRNERDPGRIRILLMSAKCPGFTPQQVANTVQGFSELQEWFDRNPEVAGRKIELVWRLTGGLAEKLGVENHCHDLSGKELVETIQSVDAVITTPSTAMLEAMLLNRPVAVLDYNHTPHWVSSAWTLSAASQIDEVIADMVRFPEAKRLFQSSSLDMALVPTNQARERLCKLIKRMLVHAAQQTDGELTFPPNLIGDLFVEGQARFDHAALYPTYSEFENGDVIQLQSNLAHSRREISNLQAEMNQLKNELAQAHEIFEQIHRHPVAGPIVRLRQKFLDWLRRNGKKNAPIQSSDSKTSSRSPSNTAVTS